VCPNADPLHLSRLGYALLQIEASVRPFFYVCNILAGHITE
jgi:hypothetical protein